MNKLRKDDICDYSHALHCAPCLHYPNTVDIIKSLLTDNA